MRPLDRLQSIKVKLGVVILATVGGHRAACCAAGRRLGVPLLVRAPSAGSWRWPWCSSWRAG